MAVAEELLNIQVEAGSYSVHDETVAAPLGPCCTREKSTTERHTLVAAAQMRRDPLDNRNESDGRNQLELRTKPASSNSLHQQ